MTPHDGSRISADEQRKRKRESFIIAFSLLLIIFLTATEIHLTRLSSDVPIGNNILIFGLINIIILLIILLIYLLVRNITKLIVERRQNVLGAQLRTKLVLA